MRVASTNRSPACLAAINHAHEVCDGFDAGDPVQGFDYEKVGVQFYCSDYLEGFKVIPTPEQQADAYYNDLEKADLAVGFRARIRPSKAAQQVCSGFEAGGKVQGLQADQIAVDHYCADLTDEFHLLHERIFSGTFTVPTPTRRPTSHRSPASAGVARVTAATAM